MTEFRRMAGAWRAVAVTACMAWAGAATAADEPRLALSTNLDLAADTDDFRILRVRAGGLYQYLNPWSFSGAKVQSTHYTQGAFRRDVAALLGRYRDQRRDTLAGVDIEAGVARVSGHLRPVGDATLRLATTLGTAVDLIASADLVETPKALERGIGYTFLAANVEHPFGERLTATALAGWQHFSDGNARAHFRARLIWLAIPEQGVTMQLRYRQYATREANVGGAYFNPDEYRQWLGVVAIRKRHAGWVFSGALGAGREDASASGSRPSYLVEARGEGPITGDVRLAPHAGYSRSVGFIASPDYAYRSAGATLLLPFR